MTGHDIKANGERNGNGIMPVVRPLCILCIFLYLYIGLLSAINYAQMLLYVYIDFDNIEMHHRRYTHTHNERHLKLYSFLI